MGVAQHRLELVDVFVDGPFTGNPAAVVRLAREVDDGWMAQVAAELDRPATAFLRDGALRWFSPSTELEICGHGTLAAAHVTWTEPGAVRAPVSFATAAGVLEVLPDVDGGSIAFSPDPTSPVSAPPGLVEALGVAPVAVVRGLCDQLVELEGAGQVAGLRPDLAALAELDVRAIIVTAPGGDGVDVTSRVFAPRRGLPEDAATGSAHRTLGSYWAPRLGRAELRCRQASARGGLLTVRVDGERVLVGGQATTVAVGTLAI